MNSFAFLMLFGWVPLTAAMFVVFRPRQALLITYVAGWLFLPTGGVDIHGLPPFGKVAAISCGALLGVMLFDPARISHFRMRWFDWPMLIWCLCPMASALSNGLGAYNGLSEILGHVLVFGLPYLFGRLYLTNLEAFHDVAIVLFVSGLLYVPLCLYEMRMSPQIHRIFYGDQLQSFVHSKRFGGWRPIVFLYGGGDLGMWMFSASLAGLVIWRQRIIQYLYGLPIILFCVALWVTTIMTKSMAAMVLASAATTMYFVVRSVSTSRMLLLALIASIPLVIVAKVGFDWQGQRLIALASSVSEGRAQSLAFRFKNEKILMDKAHERPWFGWGGYGRSRVYNEHGKDISVTDSLMIIALGQNGLLGVASLFTAMLLPLFLIIGRMPSGMWRRDQSAVLLLFTLLLWMEVVDKLLNATATPLYGLVGGGLITVAAHLAVAPRPRQAQAPGHPAPALPPTAESVR